MPLAQLGLIIKMSVVYYSAQNLLSDIEREKFSGARPHTESKALGCDLLIIDDLGSEFSTQFTVSQIYNILNDRFYIFRILQN